MDRRIPRDENGLAPDRGLKVTAGIGIARAARGTVEPAGSKRSYVPGVCNIGPAEIARRRRAGHAGLIATLAFLAALLALHAPSAARLILFVPAAGAAIGYLQAWFRFCAGFGGRGVFNFDVLGRTDAVIDPVARAKDRALATRLALASAAIGLVVAVVAVLLPA